MIGLCDCNSFYASCERLFRPDLRNKPVIVLSNNDGCIVAASSEAKALGIARGATYKAVQDELQEKGIVAFSSNYAFYQDISDRVMDILRSNTDAVLPYSIDEAFFETGNLPTAWNTFEQEIRELHDTVEGQSGVPVSIGIARTKTLAKISNHLAKKQALEGYHILRPEDEEQALRHTPLHDVWGIGRRRSVQMAHQGIKSAWDFANRDDRWIEKHYTVTGLQTAWELRGKDVINEQEQQVRSLCSGITFATPLSSLQEISNSISCHCTILSDKLWARNLLATTLVVNIFTNRFKENYQCPALEIRFEQPTAYTPALYQGALQVLHHIFQQGIQYRGSRVWITGFIPMGHRQYSLFDSQDMKHRMEQEDRLSLAVRQIGQEYGRRSLLSGATDMKLKLDLSNQEHLSPHYTTRWNDLPVAW